MRHDVLSDVLSAVKNADNVGKTETIVSASNMVKEILIIFQKNGYIGNFEMIEDGKGNQFKIELFGKINNCGSIRPRYSTKADNYEKWERRFLPAANVGLLIVSTSQGIVTYHESKEKKIGGKLLAFIY
ncbi:MAG: 30S ribosomal protein S8 [Nanoarchaeota archaeon]|nr:30S ribosomal protein S8 [Nanoarchaeota archaeon]